jgi:WD40 repeat protein/basic membrane lipoprotein Med (substrate-binding protein (PBP1-ABC) superfamily)
MTGSIPPQTLEKFTTFGDLLRFLRRRMGLTQLELSIAVGYSDTQITRLEKNQRPPDIPTIESRFVEALSLEHEPEAVARLLDLAANVRREDAPAFGVCPYKGLNYFDEADADLFVGREALSSKLIQRVMALTTHDQAQGGRFLAIVGASGSGKSSLVRAGLVSALRWEKKSADWQIHILTPTARPLESLAASLTSTVAETVQLMDDLTRDPRSLHIFATREITSRRHPRLLLVVDQFEELFALCRSEDERTLLIDNLLTAAFEQDGPVMVVITLRADFYASCAGYPALRQALATQQEYVGAMTHDELQRAIEEPARRGNWGLEPGLVDLLLHDVGHEPGALPLLSHALLETWQRRRGRTLTLGGYASSGGVRGAIAETAEEVYTDQFSREQQQIARRIFLRLTELGKETATADTRRRATFKELVLKPEETDATRTVLTALADARLITISEDAAEVAHEVLIREWPTLRGWLEDNREGLRLQRQLTEAAQDWERLGLDPDALYRGSRLVQARSWAEAHHDEMNEFEQQFLATSVAEVDREAIEHDAQGQRELDAASRELAASAISNLDADPERSILLALAALDKSHTLEAEEALHRALQTSRVEQTLQAHQPGGPISVAFSPEGKRLVTAGDDQIVKVWDAASGRLLFSVTGYPAVISPDGKRLASISIGGRVKLWDAETGKEWHSDNRIEADVGLAFSPDGTCLATASSKGAKMWDAATAQELLSLSGGGSRVNGVAFSPDGSRLAAAGDDGTATIWNAATGENLLSLSTGSGVLSAVFSPDGKRIATACASGNKVWDASTGKELLNLRGHTNGVYVLAFSPDGTQLATGSLDRRVKIWDAQTGRELFTLAGHTREVRGLAFSPDGTRLATGGADGTVRVWDLTPNREGLALHTREGPTDKIMFSADGSRVATIDGDGTVWVWDAATGEELPPASGQGAPATSIALSADGRLLAAAQNDSTVQIWDTNKGKTSGLKTNHTGRIKDVALSPDGSRLATAGSDWQAKLWDVASGKLLFTLQHPAPVFSITFSPDGARLATTAANPTVRIWAVTTGEEVLSLYGHTDTVFEAAFSPEGTRVATASRDGTAKVWDAETGKELLSLRGDSSIVGGVSFSPDGERIATANRDGTAKLWDAATGQELLTLLRDGSGLNRLAFGPYGDLLATSGDDGVRLYPLQIENLMDLARRRVTRPLTADERQKYLHLDEATRTPLSVSQSTPTLSARLVASTAKTGLIGLLAEGGSLTRPTDAQVYRGVQEAVQRFGWESTLLEQGETSTIDSRIQQFLASDCDLIVTIFYQTADAVVAAANANPSRKFLGLDFAPNSPIRNVWGQVYATHQPAFLAGYVAAAATRSGRVGTFGGVDFYSVEDYMDGFARGVSHYNEKNGTSLQVLGWDVQKREGLFTGTFTDRDAGKAMTQQLMDDGADIILPVAGPTIGPAAMETVHKHGDAYVIGVDHDWTIAFPQYSDIILTTVEKRMDVSVMRTVEAIVNGKFTGGTHTGTLETGEVEIAPFHELDPLISAKVKADLAQIRADIIAGRIKTRP